MNVTRHQSTELPSGNSYFLAIIPKKRLGNANLKYGSHLRLSNDISHSFRKLRVYAYIKSHSRLRRQGSVPPSLFIMTLPYN